MNFCYDNVEDFFASSFSSIAHPSSDSDSNFNWQQYQTDENYLHHQIIHHIKTTTVVLVPPVFNFACLVVVVTEFWYLGYVGRIKDLLAISRRSMTTMIVILRGFSPIVGFGWVSAVIFGLLGFVIEYLMFYVSVTILVLILVVIFVFIVQFAPIPNMVEYHVSSCANSLNLQCHRYCVVSNWAGVSTAQM